MFSHLLLLPLLGFSQQSPFPIAPTPPNTGDLEFTFKLPKICVDCCADIMFILDRSSSVAGPANDKRIHWNRMKNIVAQLAADPLNRARVRTGAMQMGNPTKSSTTDLKNADAGGAASGNTGIRFGLESGPFPTDIDAWGKNDDFSSNDQAAWRTAAEVALEHFTTSKNPWDVDTALTKRCDPANHARLMVWIVDGGPNPADNDPCPALIPTLVEAGIQQHIVGVGPAWANAIEGRKCMFSKGADTSNSLHKVADWPELKPAGDECKKPPVSPLFNLEPCNRCNAYLDIVFVLDESGSMCLQEGGDSSLAAGICEKRPEFDRQVKFVGQMIAELGKNWNNHRVALWTFGTTMIPHLKLSQSGAKSAMHHADGKDTYASANPKTEPQVQDVLQVIKAEYREGFTATALAYNQALGEIEFAAPRADGKKAKKVLVFLTDGGPNPPYYKLDAIGKRTTCPKNQGGSENGYCLHWQRFWDGSTEAAQKGQMNMAVCTDSGDPDPKWVRWRAKKSGGHERFIEAVKTYADAAPTLDLTPLILMVGARAEQHIKDIECLVSKTKKGGYLRAQSFEALLANGSFRSAFLNSACTDAPLGQRRGVLARYAEYEAYQQQQLMTKFQEMAMSQQLQLSPAETSSNSSYVWSGALVIGVGVAAFLYGKKSRAEYYTPLLSDELMDTDRV